MTGRALSFRYFDGPDVANTLLREVWSLRVDMLALKATQEEDWQRFSAFVRRPDTALIAFFDEKGDVQGFFSMSYIPIEHDTRKHLLLFSKYFYFREAYRGHYKTLLAPWVLLPLGWRRYGFRHLHFVTSCYPQSYVSLSRASGNVRTLRSEGLADWEVAAMREFARGFYGQDFDEEAGLIANQNVVDTEAVTRSEEGRRLTAEYERLNPDWREGSTLPIIFSVNAPMLHHGLMRAFRRAMPRSTATPRT